MLLDERFFVICHQEFHIKFTHKLCLPREDLDTSENFGYLRSVTWSYIMQKSHYQFEHFRCMTFDAWLSMHGFCGKIFMLFAVRNWEFLKLHSWNGQIVQRKKRFGYFLDLNYLRIAHEENAFTTINEAYPIVFNFSRISRSSLTS